MIKRFGGAISYLARNYLFELVPNWKKTRRREKLDEDSTFSPARRLAGAPGEEGFSMPTQYFFNFATAS